MPVIEGAVKEVLDNTEWADIVFQTDRNKKGQSKNSPLSFSFMPDFITIAQASGYLTPDFPGNSIEFVFSIIFSAPDLPVYPLRCLARGEHT